MATSVTLLGLTHSPQATEILHSIGVELRPPLLNGLLTAAVNYSLSTAISHRLYLSEWKSLVGLKSLLNTRVDAGPLALEYRWWGFVPSGFPYLALNYRANSLAYFPALPATGRNSSHCCHPRLEEGWEK